MSEKFRDTSVSRRFGAERPDAQGSEINLLHSRIATQPFRPLPTPTGAAPYHVALEDILPASVMQSILAAKKMVFHTIGDTGGVKNPADQQLVVSHMENDLAAANIADRPAFFYHLGDVIYYYGEESQYYSQFYEPDAHYQAPIFAIPGNHDGDLIDQSVPSLQAFVTNFCTETPQLASASGDAPRDTMTQPNVYWSLYTPYATFIGLYTNVPEGGQLDDTQIAWFHNELKQAPTDKAVIVAMHHPIYSADSHHSGSKYMEGILDAAMDATGRIPHLVLTAHVHNYQRFTRTYKGATIPYLVAGSGGYWNLHLMLDAIRNPTTPIQFPYPLPDRPDVSLHAFSDTRHGYLKMTVTPDAIQGEYYTVPRSQESWSAPAALFDQFSLPIAIPHVLVEASHSVKHHTKR
jgi:acid phosphatase type 7